MSAETRSPRELEMARLNHDWQDRSLSGSERADVINRLRDLHYQDYSIEHPWLAMGVPRGYQPGLGGTSFYENVVIAILSGYNAYRSLCPAAPSSETVWPRRVCRRNQFLATDNQRLFC